MTGIPLTVGFIPLVDAAALIVAVDRGFAAVEGLELALVREVSWSNVRDKLNVGLFDAAHLLAPVAIASSLGLAQVRVPIVAPFDLGLNGNAITVSPSLHAAILAEADGDPADPMVSATALGRVVAARRADGREPLIFGMTFPFSTHNYQLRFWMAAGGVDPDEDVRLVVLPPPYMVESLASGHVDAFCVGAPWSAVAVDIGIGRILHSVADLFAHAAEKVLAVREPWAAQNPETLAKLIRASRRAADFIADPANRDEVVNLLAHPERIGVDTEAIRRSFDAVRVSPAGAAQGGAGRPDPVQAAWLYAQMARWGQAAFSPQGLDTARRVFRPDLYDAALGRPAPSAAVGDGIGAFTGPAFDAGAIPAYLAAFPIRHGRG